MKNTYIRIRLTDEDKQLIREQAQNRQVNISEYIRFLVYKDRVMLRLFEKGADNGTEETI